MTLPAAFSNVDYEITLFDQDHNNPAAAPKGSGNPAARLTLKRNAADLVLNLTPNSLLIFTSIDKGAAPGAPPSPKP